MKNYSTSAAASDTKESRPRRMDNFTQEYNTLCHGKWQKNYSKLHQNILGNSKKFLIFKCSKAGWGNRIRALFSSFHLAVVAKRAFIIDCQRPSPLERYLAPNFIKWNFAINSTGLSVRYQNPGSQKLGSGWKDTDFDVYFNHSVEVIYNFRGNFYEKLKANPKYNLPPWPNRYLLLGCSFHFLFRKSDYLENNLKQERETLGFNENIVIGIHIRHGDTAFGLQGGDVRIRKIEDTDHYFACAEKIDKRIQEKYNTRKVIWFLATDSVEIKYYAKKKYPEKVRQLDRPIEHIARPRKGNEDAGHLSMFLDYFLLQQSDFRLFTTMSTFPDSISILTLGYANVGVSSYKDNRTSCQIPSSLNT